MTADVLPRPAATLMAMFSGKAFDSGLTTSLASTIVPWNCLIASCRRFLLHLKLTAVLGMLFLL
jgi:hypothetical protein